MEGKVFVFGDNVDTDAIIPACYLNSFSEENLRTHCMEFLAPEFSQLAKKGDVLVAGSNFGCGSSREHAPLALKACGIGLVVAKSFARIFFRNSINIGLPVVESADIAADAEAGDEITYDLDAGIVENLTKNKKYNVPKTPEFFKEITNAGGLMNAIRRKDE